MKRKTNVKLLTWCIWRALYPHRGSDMLTGLYAKLIGLGLTLAALAGIFVWGHHMGAVSVQKRWDAAKVAQAAAVDRQAAASAAQTLTWTQQFAATATHFEGRYP